ISAQLYLAGRLAPSFGQPVHTRWRPDRVERRSEIDGWQVETVTVCPRGEPGGSVPLRARHTGPQRTLRLGVWLTSTVTRSPGPGRAAEPPQAVNHTSRSGARVLGSDQSAWAVQELVLPEGAQLLDGGPRVVQAEVE